MDNWLQVYPSMHLITPWIPKYLNKLAINTYKKLKLLKNNHKVECKP